MIKDRNLKCEYFIVMRMHHFFEKGEIVQRSWIYSQKLGNYRTIYQVQDYAGNTFVMSGDNTAHIE